MSDDLDRNKTPLTHAITRRVALWMDERGFKPVETEVSVGGRWVADLAGVITPTQTELIELKLIKRAPRTYYDMKRGENVGQEAYDAWRTAKDALPTLLTCAIEVKVSRGDFMGDWKWQAPAQTDLRYLAIPEGLIPDYEWPQGWGVIVLSKDGSTVRKVHRPTVTPMTTEQRLQVVLALATRQYNTVRYARTREWQREVNLRHAHERVTGRIQDAIGVVADVIRGETVERALSRRGIRAKLPDWTLEQLEALRPSNRPVSLTAGLEVVA